MSRKESDSYDGTLLDKKIDKNEKKESKSTPSHRGWILTVLCLTLVISFSIGFVTELIYMVIEVNIWRIIIAIVLVLVIIMVSIISDMIGVAATSADEQPFLAMASRKIKGSKRAVILCRNADKVSSLLNDIIGDVCGIISGASGATISAVIVSSYTELSIISNILISVIVSALIAGITITGKAIAKSRATTNANEILFSLAKFLSIFDKDK